MTVEVLGTRVPARSADGLISTRSQSEVLPAWDPYYVVSGLDVVLSNRTETILPGSACRSAESAASSYLPGQQNLNSVVHYFRYMNSLLAPSRPSQPTLPQLTTSPDDLGKAPHFLTCFDSQRYQYYSITETEGDVSVGKPAPYGADFILPGGQ